MQLLHNPETGATLAPRLDGHPINGVPAPWVALDIIEHARPESYDDSTHRLERINDEIHLDAAEIHRGWRLVELTPEEVAARQVVAPISLQRHQFEAALALSGVSESAVLAAIDGIEDEQVRMLASIGWAKAPNVAQDNAVVGILAAALGLTDEGVAAIFALGQTLYV